MTAISLPTKTSARLEAWAPLATCCLVLLLPAIWLLVQGDICDPDIWWHLRTGRWIVEHRALPTVDYFSDYGQGKPWLARSWLAELLLYGLCQAFGFFGLRIFLATMAVAILGALYVLLRRLQPNHRLTAIMTLVAAAGMFTMFSPRTWLFSILFSSLSWTSCSRPAAAATAVCCCGCCRCSRSGPTSTSSAWPAWCSSVWPRSSRWWRGCCRTTASVPTRGGCRWAGWRESSCSRRERSWSIRTISAFTWRRWSCSARRRCGTASPSSWRCPFGPGPTGPCWPWPWPPRLP